MPEFQIRCGFEDNSAIISYFSEKKYYDPSLELLLNEGSQHLFMKNLRNYS